jgi:hypothetical protein
VSRLETRHAEVRRSELDNAKKAPNSNKALYLGGGLLAITLTHLANYAIELDRVSRRVQEIAECRASAQRLGELARTNENASWYA